jgi:putative CocE/NonD family hydrolase
MAEIQIGAAERGAGTEMRMWVAGRETPRLRPDRYETTEQPMQVPVRDGISLAAVLLAPALPEGAPLPPCIVVTNGYSGLDYSLLPNYRELAARGYPVLLCRLRGVSPSEGKAGLYEQYGPDGHDVIEWAAAQPWTNGKVGMVGASLLGISQWLAAKEHPEHLVVLVPDDSPNNTYDYLWYAGGLKPGPGRKGRAAVPGVESEYDVAIDAPWFDEFWAQRSATREDIQQLAREGMPALTSSGWDSYMVDAASRAFTWMREAGAGSRARLVIGPWPHAGMFSLSSTRGDVAPGETIHPYTGFEIQLMWLDRWLLDERNGIEEEPPVLIYVQGPNQWRREHDWPLPDERRTRLYLDVDRSGTSSSHNDGTLSTGLASVAAANGYAFDPATARNPVDVSMMAMQMVADAEPIPLPVVLPEGASRPYGRLIMDKANYEARALTWTSSVLQAPTEVTGYPRLVLWASVSSPDAAFIAELMDVGPGDSNSSGAEGLWTSVQITRGSLRAGAQVSRTHPVELSADDVMRFEFELSPTSYVVPAGHRVRLTLQGAPIDPDLELSWHGPGLNEEPFSFTVHSGPSFASYLDVPTIGDSPSF